MTFQQKKKKKKTSELKVLKHWQIIQTKHSTIQNIICSSAFGFSNIYISGKEPQNPKEIQCKIHRNAAMLHTFSTKCTSNRTSSESRQVFCYNIRFCFTNILILKPLQISKMELQMSMSGMTYLLKKSTL